MNDLKTNIKMKMASVKGTFALSFKNLETGEILEINEKENFHAASTMKIPVMVEVYRQAKEGILSLSDSVVLKNEFKSIADSSVFSLDPADDSETELYKHLGEKRTVSFLVYQMIIVSSNLATNLIMELAGAANVMKTLHTMGIQDMKVLRGVEDNKAFQKGLNNTTTAHDMMLLMEKMAKGETVSKEASDEMIKILLDQKFNEIIPAQLPAGVKVAHKTGWITASHHDAAIVYLPNGKKYVLVILSKNLADEKEGVKMMSDISLMIYKYVAGKNNRH